MRNEVFDPNDFVNRNLFIFYFR